MPGITDIGLLSAAYTRLGQKPIYSLSEDTDEGKLAVANYSLIRRAMLASHPWRFASALVSIDADAASADPYLDEGQYVFTIPPEAVLVLGDKDGNPVQRYRRKKVYASVNPVSLLIVEDVDEEDFPPMFADALATELAMRLCYATTQDLTLTQQLTIMAKEQWFRARNADMREVVPPGIDVALDAYSRQDTSPRNGNSTLLGA